MPRVVVSATSTHVARATSNTTDSNATASHASKPPNAMNTRLAFLALLFVACGSENPPAPSPRDATPDTSALDVVDVPDASSLDGMTADAPEAAVDASAPDVVDAVADVVTDAPVVDASTGVTIEVWDSRGVSLYASQPADCRSADTTRRYPASFSVVYPAVSIVGVLALNSANHAIEATTPDGGMLTTQPSRIQFGNPYTRDGVRRTNLRVTVQNNLIAPGPAVDLVINGCLMVP